MKNSKMIVTALIIFFMFSYAKAQEDIKIDFDGRSSITMNIIEVIKSDINNTNAMEMPALEFEPETSDKIDRKELNKNLDYSIKSALEYCRKNNISEFITDNLKKLLVYGTYNEKLQFMKSSSYTFPDRFKGLNNVDFKNILLNGINKGQLIQVCEQKNCRIEEVCGFKEVCEWITEIVCSAAAGAAGGAITGGVGGGVVTGVASTIICKPITKRVCKNVKDCQNVEKCDTVCRWEDTNNVQPGQCVSTPQGSVCQ